MTDPIQRELETISAAVTKALRRVAAESPVKLDARLLACVLEAGAHALKVGAARHPPKPTSELFIDPGDAFRAFEPDPFRRAALRLDVASAVVAALTANGSPMDPGKLAEALRQTATQLDALVAAERAAYGEPRAISNAHGRRPTADEIREACRKPDEDDGGAP